MSRGPRGEHEDVRVEAFGDLGHLEHRADRQPVDAQTGRLLRQSLQAQPVAVALGHRDEVAEPRQPDVAADSSAQAVPDRLVCAAARRDHRHAA